MPEIPVGQPASSGGVPARYLLIGGGAIAVAAIVLMNRGHAPVAQAGNPQDVSSPSAMLSSLQHNQLEQFGELTKDFAAQTQLVQDTRAATQADISALTGTVTDSVSGLSTHLDTAARALSDQSNVQSASLLRAISGVGGQVQGVTGLQQQAIATQHAQQGILDWLTHWAQGSTNQLQNIAVRQYYGNQAI